MKDVADWLEKNGPEKRDYSGIVDYYALIKQAVVKYFNERVEKTDTYQLKEHEVYVVWFTKTLQNWKAMASTTVPDGMYYELTFNGDKAELYLDAYKKFNNVTMAFANTTP